MSEFKFVLRCLVVTSLILIASQYKWENETLESKAQSFLAYSESSAHLREIAAGGVRFIKNSGEKGYEYIQEKFFRDKHSDHSSRNNQ